MYVDFECFFFFESLVKLHQECAAVRFHSRSDTPFRGFAIDFDIFDIKET